jgi:hypothetical protein
MGQQIATYTSPATMATASGAVSVAALAGDVYVAICWPMSPPIVGFSTGVSGGISPVSDQGCAHGLGVAGNRLAWTSDTALLLAPSSAGGQSALLASPVHPSPLMAAAAAAVYWWDTPAAPAPHALMRVELPTGSPTTIVQGDLTALAADDIAAYWSDASGIHAVNHAGSTIADLSGPALAGALASDGVATLYAGSPQGIQAIPLAGGTATVLSQAQQVTGIAASGALVYWADAGDGTLRRAAAGGGGVTVLASGQSFVSGAPIALDTSAVYWLATEGSTVALRAMKR